MPKRSWTIHIDTKLLDECREAATADKRSLNSFVVMAIEFGLEIIKTKSTLLNQEKALNNKNLD